MSELLQDLRRMLAYMEAGLDQIKEALVWTDSEGKVQWCNDIFSNLIKKQRVFVFQTNIEEYFPEAKEWMQSEGAKSYEFEYKRSENETLYLEVKCTSFIAENKKSFVFSYSDITEKKASEFQVLQMQKLEGIGSLAAGIAHEINTPIQYIGDNIAFLEDVFQKLMSALYKKDSSGIDYDFLKEEVPNAFKQTKEGIDYVSKIVQSVKEFSHPTQQEMVSVEIQTLIKKIVLLTKNRWKYQAELSTYLDEKIITIMSNPYDLSQIILNLIINASDAIEERKKIELIEGRINVRLLDAQNDVKIIIEDNGCGIPDKIKSRIFEPFFTTKPLGKGTGQGLAIAFQSVTTRLKGKISLESTINVGTKFTITLPKWYESLNET